MRRFLVPPDVLAGVPPGGEVVLRGGEARHAAVVLRLRKGDEIAVFDGAGAERVVALSDVSPEQVVGRVLDTRQGITPPVRLILLQGVPKGAKMDEVIRMGTELGVGRFLPLRTRRAVGESRGRVERWRRIASAAAAQSRRVDVPTVSAPQTVPEALEQLPSDALLLVLWEGERSRTIGAALRAGPVSEPVAVLVGPEGGLTEEEVALAVSRGGTPVTLGPLVLRTETAGMAALAMVLYERALRG
jgi:16S rRNA (uracil1498-N3)-methyltransferase